MKTNFGSRYKTGQLHDLAKRVYNAVHRDLNCLDTWGDFFGEFTDFAHADINSLTALQNLHVWSKLVSQSLMSSYPESLMVTLFFEGCKLLVAALLIGFVVLRSAW